MSDIKLTHATSLKQGSYLLVDGNPCIVKSTSTSRPGKHGHAKVRIKATDIFTGSTKEVVKPGHDNVEVPVIYKKKAQVLSVEGDAIELMDMETFETVSTETKYVDNDVRGIFTGGDNLIYQIF